MITRRRSAAVVMAAVGLLVLTGCPADPGVGPGPTTTIDPGQNRAPVISTFTATRSSGASPVTTPLLWTISDPDGQPLTCTLDLDQNGTQDRTVPNCTSSSVRSATFSTVGATVVALTVSDGVASTVAFTTINVAAPSSDAFNITVRMNGTMTPAQQAAFTNAAARWAQAIRSGLSTVSLNLPADDCGTGAPAFNGSIDDLLIDATIAPIDGVGSILGQAGPCYTRNGTGLPVYGVMKFDVADVADLQADGDFDAVILHEMGHVLGFGTVWSGRGLAGAGTSDPTFTGATAVGAWQAIGGSGAVPVEQLGGAGTADSHWRESVFNGELMTGWIDHNNNPMSAVTIAAFADLGYGVDLGAADPYGTPALRSGAPAPEREITTELIFPKGSV